MQKFGPFETFYNLMCSVLGTLDSVIGDDWYKEVCEKLTNIFDVKHKDLLEMFDDDIEARVTELFDISVDDMYGNVRFIATINGYCAEIYDSGFDNFITKDFASQINNLNYKQYDIFGSNNTKGKGLCFDNSVIKFERGFIMNKSTEWHTDQGNLSVHFTKSNIKSWSTYYPIDFKLADMKMIDKQRFTRAEKYGPDYVNNFGPSVFFNPTAIKYLDSVGAPLSHNQYMIGTHLPHRAPKRKDLLNDITFNDMRITVMFSINSISPIDYVSNNPILAIY